MSTGSSAATSPRPERDGQPLADWLASAPFTLALSAGFFGFFAHAGLLLALEERGLKPSRLTGASAGALAGSLWASGRSASRIREDLLALQRSDFWDPAPGLGLLRGARFRSLLERLLQVDRFEDCRVPLALSTYDLWHRRTRVFDRGPLAPVVHASCAVPLMFRPVRHEGAWLADGGLVDRCAHASVADGERVLYHHIASRSPWRRRGSPALTVPRRRNGVSLVLHGLPRSGPGRLGQGHRALELTLDAARQALDAVPIDGRIDRDLRPTGER